MFVEIKCQLELVMDRKIGQNFGLNSDECSLTI